MLSNFLRGLYTDKKNLKHSIVFACARVEFRIDPGGEFS